MEEPLITDVESPPADPAAQPVAISPRDTSAMRKPHRYFNALVKSPHYDEVIGKYADRYRVNGYVPVVDFYKEVVAPLVPEMKYESFRVFIRKFERDALAGKTQVMPEGSKTKKAVRVLLKGDEATRRGIELMLNIGQDALAEIAEKPEILSAKERAALLPIAMRAQDSRINAMARVRQDKRDQLAFEHVFGDAAYSEENE